MSIVAKFTALSLPLQTLASELVLTRARQHEKAPLADIFTEVFNILDEGATGETGVGAGATNETTQTETTDKPLTAAQKKAAAAAKKKADATGSKKPANKKKTELDLTPFKEQVANFTDWLGDDKSEEITAILEEFGAETADDVSDEQYPEYYKLIREIADAEFDLSEVPDLLAA